MVRGIVDGFAQAGADLIIAGRRQELGHTVAEEISSSYGVKAIFVTADVTTPEGIDSIVSTAMDTFGRIDILVNNAGVTHVENAEDISREDWQKVMDTNVGGLFFLSQAVGRVMIKQGGGNIINISSNSDRLVMTPQKQAVYSASKSAVDMVTKSLAYEWAQYHIRVNAIAPGYIKSDIWPQGVRADGKKFHEVWLDMIPIGRFGLREEIAGMALYIASDLSPFLTGSVLLIDGGYSLT